MADFTDKDLSGARFERARLTGATFYQVYLDQAHLRDVDLTGVVMRAVLLTDVDIDGEIDGLRVNGVDVAPMVEAELNRRYPERSAMRPTDADGYRRAWAILERLWGETFERARGLPEETLHTRVEGEWSFIETQRHLVFATDAWIRRALLGDPSPWDPLDLPFDEMEKIPGVPWDRDARPSLDRVLALRADRMATMRSVVDELTDEALTGATEPVVQPGYPESESFPVRRVLGVIINEEWQHRLYAERDLDVLTGGGTEREG